MGVRPISGSATLADAAPCGRSGIPDPGPQQGAASLTRLVGAAIATQIELVLALLTFSIAIITQGRSAAIDRRGNDFCNRVAQSASGRLRDLASGRVHPSEPERLVGINVADASDGALTEQLGL